MKTSIAIAFAAALAITTAAAVPLSAQTNTIWTAPEPSPGEVRCLEYQTETGTPVSNRNDGGLYVSDARIVLSDVGLQVWLGVCNAAAKTAGSNQRYVRCADGSFEADTRTYDGEGHVINTDYAECEHYVIPAPQPDVDGMTELERCIDYNTETNRDLPAPRDANGNEYTLKSIRESCEEILAS